MSNLLKIIHTYAYLSLFRASDFIHFFYFVCYIYYIVTITIGVEHLANTNSYSSGIGIDDMFILMSGMAEGPSLTTASSIKERMKYMLQKSGVAITITSITDLLAFTIGATSVFISIRTFCIYTGNKSLYFSYS